MNRKYRDTIIAGNWKMNVLPSEIRDYADKLRLAAQNLKASSVVICVSPPLIPAAKRAFKSCRVAVGAQNVNENASGAYTGEVSAAQLRDLGVGYCIVGHSERREYYGEDDAAVSRKALACIASDIRPIICVGERLAERERGVTSERVSYQLKTALCSVPAEKMGRVIIAYEPVWAIGTGKTASPEDAQEVCAELRAVVRKLYGARAARSVPILYGGSMNDKNAPDLLSQPDIDGGLIGGASLKPADFSKIILAASEN